jgi:hypothetical protein
MQPLQSVKCHDSRAHGPEQHGSFTRLVGIWFGWFWLRLPRSSLFGSWYVGGAKPVCMVLDLATGVRHVSFLVLATGVRPMSYVWFWLQG